MPYFKITYESDTIEGLKAVQGSSAGHSASLTNAANSENSVPPPPLKQDVENTDAFSGMQAPPPAADNSSGFSDGNAIQSPPPTADDVAEKTDIGSEGETQPPPTGEMQKQEADESEPNKSPKEGKKKI